MIPVKTAMTQVDELPGEEREFSIGDPRWVMKTQADLYSNRELAVTREYSTNAFDANNERAAAEGRAVDPIEVTLPSMMNPYFSVKDKGFGMSRETLLDTYTQFGTSTKRDSNLYNGILGYGSKSAAAYADTFTVISVHQGVKTNAVVIRRPDWSIVMKIVSQEKTADDSGTEIIVPVSDHQKFTHIANDFYKFWLPGRVLVNGAEPTHNVGEKVTDGLYYSTSWSTSYVVMGNVPYRIANPEVMFRNSKMSRINFVAYVDTVTDAEGNEVAAVEFTPSREDLKYTDHTIATLQQVIANFEKQIVDSAQAEIDGATTHAEAFKAWRKWTDTLGERMFADLTFKGDRFEPVFAVRGTRWSSNQYSRGTQTIRDYAVQSMAQTMFVTECDVNISTNVRNKAREYAQQENWPYTHVVFITGTADTVVSKWITKDHFVTWADLKAALPKATPTHRASGKPRRVKGSFDFYTLNGLITQQPLPDDTTDVFWTSLRQYKRDDWALPSLLRSTNMAHAKVVVLPQNRIEKFKRENPQVQEIHAFAKTKVVLDGASLLSDDAKAAMAVDDAVVRWADKMDLSKVKDPMFAEAQRLSTNKDTLTAAYQANLNLASLVNMRYNVSEHKVVRTGPLLYDRYPLLMGMSTSYARYDHLYLYLNTVYSAIKK